jgi:adenylate cyclase
MQLTARQREFVRIAGWVLPVSITLGAVFGHFQAQNGSIWGYVQGAVTAIVISCTILLLEFAVFSRTRSALARRMPFLLYLMLRSLGYLAVILMGLTVSAWLLRQSAERPLIERGSVVFSLVLSLGFNLLIGVNDLLGQGVLFNFVAGRYRRPRVEDRVLLFIDMESSSVLGRPASSIFSTGLSPMSRNRSWRSAARFTNMSATRSSSLGHLRLAFGTGTASTPASTPWSS